MATTSLLDIVNEYLTSDRLQLPVLAPSALELQEMLARNDVDIEKVAARIMQDQALAGQVLRVANSAFYGGLRQVATIREAIMRLGTREVLDLVTLTTQRQRYRSVDPALQPYFDNLWKHAASCALGCKWLARQTGHNELAQLAFMAGLLHDIGQLFLIKALESVRRSPEVGVTISDHLVKEILDTLHTSQGKRLLQSWNLPQIYCDAADLHEIGNYDCSNPVITITRLANMTCHKLGIGLKEDPSLVLATTKEVKSLQLSEIRLAELEILLEDAMNATS